jgi:hypothetical protein
MRWSGILWKDPTFDLSGTNPKSGLPPLRTSRTHGLEVKAPVEGFRLLKVAMEGSIRSGVGTAHLEVQPC